MDFSKPPKTPGIQNRTALTDFDRLHPDQRLRYKFYRQFLVPIGHASFSSEESPNHQWCTYLSDEFCNAFQNDEELKEIKAFFNLIL
jgi:hypothetical protein